MKNSENKVNRVTRVVIGFGVGIVMGIIISLIVFATTSTTTSTDEWGGDYEVVSSDEISQDSLEKILKEHHEFD